MFNPGLRSGLRLSRDARRLKRLATGYLLAAGLVSSAIAQTPVSNAVTYQGQLAGPGGVISGTADLNVTLFDAATGGAPLGTVNLTNVAITDGRFTAQLDFGNAAFSGSARWLEFAVRSPAGSGPFTTLLPRQSLTATPFALSLAPGAIVSGPPRGWFEGVMTVRATQPGIALSAFGNSASDTALLGVNGDASAVGALGSGSYGVYGTSSTGWSAYFDSGNAYFGANVGIGTTTPTSKLDVAGTIESDGFKLNGNGAGPGKMLVSDATGVATWQTAPTGSQWTTNGNNIGYTAGNVGIGTTSPNMALDVRANDIIGTSATPSGDQHAVANRGTKSSFGYRPVGTAEFVGMRTLIDPGTNGCGNTADIRFDTWECGTSISREIMRISGRGNVGIGTTAPAFPLHISSPSHTPVMVESASTVGTWLNLRNASAGGRYWQLISTGSGNGGGAGKLLVGSGTSAGLSDPTMTLTSDAKVGIGTLSPVAPLHVATGTDSSPTGGGYIVSGDPAGLSISIDNNEIMARDNGATSTLYLNNNGGNVVVPVLQITGGSDVAEPFNVNSDNDADRRDGVRPGMVVTIDPRRVGELRLSSSAYDKTVAGIISGANGVNPGMVLTQTGSVADGKHPVALTGRVWCWCDADAAGPISAGDMLTTSDTPGHAMRVTDHDRAHGAVIGKAMSSLESGQALVLVLVNLQ